MAKGSLAGVSRLEPTLGWMIKRAANVNPDGEALIADERRYSYQQLNERVNRISNALKNLGVKKSDKVSLLLYNCSEFIESVYGISKLGAVAVPLNYRLKQDELEYIIRHSDAVTLIYDYEFDSLVSRLKSKLPCIKNYIVVGEGDGLCLNYENVLSNSELREPLAVVRETDPASIIYTSGTTGLPKGAMLTHRNHLWSCLNSMLREGDYTQEKNVCIPIPLFHVAGFQRFLITHFLGGKNVLMRKFDPTQFLSLVQREKITATLMVPTLVTMISRLENLGEFDRSTLVSFQFGAAPSPMKLLDEIGIIFPNANASHCYGITETAATASYLPAAEFKKKMGSVGRKGQGYINTELRIIKEDGKDVSADEVGEIIIRGPNVMLGYYKNEKETEKAFFEGDWYKTGDMGMFDEDGYLFIVDRKKDMIISGGENIYCPEVESVLAGYPKVADAAVIGVADELWGEVVRAIIVVKPGETLDEQEVIEYANTKLAGYKRPQSVVFVDSLPVSGSGKVLKTVLREKYGNQ